MPVSGAFPVARRELRTRIALVLEMIALRHQIAVLERNGTRRPRLRPSDRLFLDLAVALAGLAESLKIVQPETVLRWRRNSRSRFGDIARVDVSEVDAPGFPLRSSI